MQEIKIVKASEILFEYKDGYAETEILANTCPGIRICKCRLQAGVEKELEVYGENDKMQLLFFTTKSGVLKSGHKIYSIDDQAVFIPDFDREKVTGLISFSVSISSPKSSTRIADSAPAG